jgi:hypothetical protein
MLRRERALRISEVELFARLLSLALDVPEERVEPLLDVYRLEVSQDRYHPSIVVAARKARAQRTQKAVRDAKLLDRVERLTVKDDDLPPTPRVRRRR